MLDMQFPAFEELKAERTRTAPVQLSKPSERTIKTIEALPVCKQVRAAAYCRVSTDHEDQKSSINIQRKHFASVAAANSSWEFAGIYYDIVSGTKKEKRPGLQRLLKDCEDGRVTLVLTKSVSRFARNTTDLLMMVRQLMAMDVAIVFERENIDTRTIDSEFLLTLLAMLAEDESHSTSANNQWAIQKRFKDGSYKRAVAPYGYDLVDGQLVINPVEAEVVKFIFRQVLSGIGSRLIAKDFNARGIPTKREGQIWKDSQTGGTKIIKGKWSASTVVRLIKNVVYVGDSLFQKTYTDETFMKRNNHGEFTQYYHAGGHEAIIDRKTFELAQGIIDLHHKEWNLSGRVKKAQNPFSGKLYCGLCGAPLVFSHDSRYSNSSNYWVCGRHRKVAASCSLKRVLEETIQNSFTTVMNKLAFCSQVVESYRTEQGKRWREQQGQAVVEAEKQLGECLVEKDRITKLRSQAAMETTDYITAMNMIELREREARSVLTQFGSAELNRTEELLQAVRQWESTTDFSAEAFTAHIEKVVVNNENLITFHFSCGLVLTQKG